MCVVGTNAEDANTSGNTQMKPSDCAVSGLRALIPTNALIHENTYAKPSTSANASDDLRDRAARAKADRETDERA